MSHVSAFSGWVSALFLAAAVHGTGCVTDDGAEAPTTSLQTGTAKIRRDALQEEPDPKYKNCPEAQGDEKKKAQNVRDAASMLGVLSVVRVACVDGLISEWPCENPPLGRVPDRIQDLIKAEARYNAAVRGARAVCTGTEMGPMNARRILVEDLCSGAHQVHGHTENFLASGRRDDDHLNALYVEYSGWLQFGAAAQWGNRQYPTSTWVSGIEELSFTILRGYRDNHKNNPIKLPPVARTAWQKMETFLRERGYTPAF